MLASLFELYQTGVKPCARPPCSHASATTSWALGARSASSQPTGWTSAHRTSNPGRPRSLRAGGAAWRSVSNAVASSGDRTDENLLAGVTGPPSLGVAPAVPTGTLPCRDCRLSSLLPPCQGGPVSRATSRARTRTATDTASLTRRQRPRRRQPGQEGPRPWPVNDDRRPAPGTTTESAGGGQLEGAPCLRPRGANASTQGRTRGATAAAD